MESQLLRDALVIFALAIVVLLSCHWLRIPTLVGFLITGVLAGPDGLGLVSASKEVKLLAEIGIALLLFIVGLEFSIKQILSNKRYFLIAGPLQVLLTMFAGCMAGLVVGRPLAESFFLGCILSLSSTAIVMRTLQDRAETNAPHGRMILGILIFQDIAVVPMMLITPMLDQERGETDFSLLWVLLKGILILGVVFLSASKLIPPLLYHVAKTRSRELFLLTVIVICFSVAWIGSNAGLSLALGAFLAGLIISQSEYSQQAIGNILPFQDVFTSFFFVSIGMLLDLEFLLMYPFSIILITLAVVFLKAIVASLTAFLMGMPIRTAILSGLALAQIGEFSFVLAMSGIAHGIGTDYLHKLFIAVAILSMGLTPTMIVFSHYAVRFLNQLPLPETFKRGLSWMEPQQKKEKKDHLIIVGFGFSGRALAHSSIQAAVPYEVIDMSPETIKGEKKKGEPIVFGDATRPEVLKHARVQQAKALAVLVNDPIAVLHIVELARRLNPSLYIIARARYLKEMEPLYHMGANDVIPDELGTTLEILSKVCKRFHILPNTDFIETLRNEH